MSRLARAVAALCGVIVLAASCATEPTTAAGLPTQVEGLDGEALALTDPTAVTVVAFVASWCAPCRKELPELQARHERADERVRFVAVAVQEEPVATRRLVDDTGITFPVGVDPDGVALADYGFVGLPATMLLAPDGTVEHRYSGTIDFEDLDRRLAPR